VRLKLPCLVATFLTLRAATCGDFNGDGFEDLAVSARLETISGVVNAGSIHVIPGSASGADTASAFRIDAIMLGALPEQTLALGAALAWGDFDGDGYDDLAIGSPSAHVKGLLGAGRVFVLPGSASGFDFTRLRSFDQNSKGIKDKAESNGMPGQSFDAFGAELVTGDFDGNGFDDLAINAEAEAIGKVKGAGAVHVLYGSSIGLRSSAISSGTKTAAASRTSVRTPSSGVRAWRRATSTAMGATNSSCRVRWKARVRRVSGALRSCSDRRRVCARRATSF
jgi:hypothetical protein